MGATYKLNSKPLQPFPLHWGSHKGGIEPQKEKEKITSVFSYRRDCESVGLTMITVIRDAVYACFGEVGSDESLVVRFC